MKLNLIEILADTGVSLRAFRRPGQPVRTITLEVKNARNTTLARDFTFIELSMLQDSDHVEEVIVQMARQLNES
jgi:hypothetical protein